MAESNVTIPAADLDRLVYVAIAEASNDAEIEHSDDSLADAMDRPDR